MKKTLAAVTALLLLFGLFAGAPAEAGSLSSGLAEIHVFAVPEPVHIGKHRRTGSPHYYYTLFLQETGGEGCDIYAIERSVLYEGWEIPDERYEADTLREWWGEASLKAFGMLRLGSGRAPEDGVTGEVWRVFARDAKGETRVYDGLVRFSKEKAETTPEDPDRDTDRLRHRATFEMGVAKGVSWAPAAALGGTRYSNTEIASMLLLSPGEKQAAAETLYEALQLFTVGGFRDAEDKICVEENGILWEHHKPGYHAVRANEGCCASNSNWLNYLLRGDYPQTGFLAYSQADGSGHVLNYIRDGESWWFVDLTHYRPDFPYPGGAESGDPDDYFTGDFIGGNIHKAKSPEDYVRYCLGTFNDPPGLFFLYEADDCLPLGLEEKDGMTVVIYPETEGVEVFVLYDDPGDRLTYEIVTPPTALPSWGGLPSAF